MKKNKKMQITSLILGVIGAIALAIAPNTTKEKDNSFVNEGHNLTVEFIDVGQGNCVLASINEHYMLIDGGNSDTSSFVVSYLKDKGIKTLDYVVVSHYDADHLSGIIGVLNVFNVNKVIAPDYTADTKTYNSYIKKLNEKNILPEYPSVGDKYTFGNAGFVVVCPDSYDYSDENNNSVGIKLSYGNNSFLILGDASTESEYAMLDNNVNVSADVYMVSHHGSLKSTSATFLSAINPSYAVISVGNNSYGHPKEEILKRLEKLNIPIYRTDKDGTIIFTSDGNTLSVSTL